MARHKTGRPRQFPLDYQETQQAIEKYKTFCDQNQPDIPSVPGFCAFIGTDTGKYIDTINNPVDVNNNLADLLKNFGCWCDAIAISRLSAPMARVMLAQGFGGHMYVERQESKQDIQINVEFGGSCKDPFG